MHSREALSTVVRNVDIKYDKWEFVQQRPDPLVTREAENVFVGFERGKRGGKI